MSAGPASTGARFETLDFLRGAAAILVLVNHLRAYVFVSFGEVADPSLIAKALYLLTGLGHQAVVIFFALSGFLVGGKALGDLIQGRFTWRDYFARRLTRLWIVLIPALFLTLLFDYAGLALTHGTGYDGRYAELYASGPPAGSGVTLSYAAFLGNIFFLQTIYVPIFGSNSPMWSLANEFWYYVLFPLVAWIGLARPSLTGRLIGTAIAILLLAVLPMWLLLPGIIWVAGAIASWCSRQKPIEPFARNVVARIAAILLVIVAIVLTKVRPDMVGDIVLGLIVAAALPVLAHFPRFGGLYGAVSRASSEISYTLYLTHFPLLTLICLSAFPGQRFQPGVFSAAVFSVLAVVSIAWAAIVWRCFERNTDRLYSLVSNSWLELTPQRR